MSTDPLARWTAFLEKIEARHQELLDGARDALPQLLVEADYELLPFSNALTAVRTQCLGLAHKIEQTFSDSAEAALEAAGADTTAAQRLGAELGFRLELALRAAEVEISGAAADTVMTRAQGLLAAGFKCTQCGAALELAPRHFRAQHVGCAFCRTVNTFEPGLEVRMVEHFAAHAIAERRSWPLLLALLEAEHRSGRDRHALVEHYTRFLDAYLAARADVVPEHEKTLAADRAAKLEAYIYSVA